MNTYELIKSIFENFMVDGVRIPVAYMNYEGHGEPYIVYMQEDLNDVFSADDDVVNYVEYYDFDIYAKGNYLNIARELKRVLKANGFVWQISMTSPDMYDADTGYYHKTYNFSIIKEE